MFTPSEGEGEGEGEGGGTEEEGGADYENLLGGEST
jgi:hypothetical protein